MPTSLQRPETCFLTDELRMQQVVGPILLSLIGVDITWELVGFPFAHQPAPPSPNTPQMLITPIPLHSPPHTNTPTTSPLQPSLPPIHPRLVSARQAAPNLDCGRASCPLTSPRSYSPLGGRSPLSGMIFLISVATWLRLWTSWTCLRNPSNMDFPQPIR